MKLSHCLSSVFSTAQTNIPTKLVDVCILMKYVVENIPTKLVVEGVPTSLVRTAYNSESCDQSTNKMAIKLEINFFWCYAVINLILQQVI